MYRCTYQKNGKLTNRLRIQHFTCDVAVTSFYMGLEPNFNMTSTIYAGMCMPTSVLLRLRVAKILRGRKWGQKYASPAAVGWRGCPAAAGLTNATLFSRFTICIRVNLILRVVPGLRLFYTIGILLEFSTLARTIGQCRALDWLKGVESAIHGQ